MDSKKVAAFDNHNETSTPKSSNDHCLLGKCERGWRELTARTVRADSWGPGPLDLLERCEHTALDFDESALFERGASASLLCAVVCLGEIKSSLVSSNCCVEVSVFSSSRPLHRHNSLQHSLLSLPSSLP